MKMLPFPSKLSLATGLFLATLIGGCSEEPPVVALAPGEAPPPIEVTVTTLEPQTWRGTVRSFGAIEALEEVNVAAEVSGTVAAIHINEGDVVKPGQLLLELDPEKQSLAVEQAKNEAAQTRAALEEARLRLQRRLNLAQRETISREVLDNAELAVDRAGATYQQAVAALQLAERELADTRITSPTGGVVDVRAVEPGEAVQVGASLVTLQAVGALRVQTWVSEFDVSYLRPGGDARVFPSGMPMREFPALVEWVGVNADARTGNFPVKLILEAGVESLRPGMTVSVELAAEEITGALILPERALVDYKRRRVVFIDEDGFAGVREPVLATGLNNNLLILSGLAPGDRIITSGQHRLIEGTAISTSETE